MKTTLRTTLTCFAFATAFGYAGDDFLAPSSEPDYVPSLDSSLGKAVIENNYRNSRNLFLEATGGVVFATSGQLTDGINKSLDGSAFGGKGYKSSANIHGRSIDDIYGVGNAFSLRLGLDLNRTTTSYDPKNPFVSTQNNGRVYVRVSRNEFDGGSARLGYIDDCTLDAHFDDFQDWGIAIGYERDFGTGRLRPFVGVEAGIRFVSDIEADFRAADAHHFSDYNNISLYEDSVALGLLFSFGIDYHLTDNFAIGIESGIGYQTGLDADDSELAQFDISELNDAGGNFWSIPVLVSARLTF